MKAVRLQHRTYLGKDCKTKYVQHRINIPDSIIQKIGWKDQEQITISVESSSSKKNDKKRIILIAKD